MLDLDKVISAAVFVGLRVSGFLLFAPVVGGTAVPVRVKACLALALTLLLCSFVPGASASAALGRLPGLFASELIIGMVLGLAVQLVFEAAQLAGHILGVQMGFSLVNVLDPQTQVDTPIFAAFQQTLVILIFLRLNVHLWLLRALAHSFDYIPSGTAFFSGHLTEALVRSASGIWMAGVQIAAPALTATIFADLLLAFIGKASPQLPVLFLGLSIKTLLSLVITIAALAAWPSIFERHFAQAVASGEHMLHLAR